MSYIQQGLTSGGTLKESSGSSSKYWAAQDSNHALNKAYEKCEQWFRNILQNEYLNKVKRSWHYYHGSYYDSWRNSHNINFSGDNGEYVNLAVNHYRNIAVHMAVAITSNKPVPQCRASNSDQKSLMQTQLAQGIIEYYNREKKLDRFFADAAEYAVVMGSGFIKLGWDATKGSKPYDYIQETQTTIYPGDIDVKILSPFDVVFDSTKEHPEDNEWVITRSWANKHNLAIKYFEYADKIEMMTTKSDNQSFRLNNYAYDQTDDIAVYELFHKPCDVLPVGRYMIFLASNICLYDSLANGDGMPYRELPVYRIAPSNILGTPYGYSPMWDYLPIQDAINSLYSIILTNQNAFGVQNVMCPRSADISIDQIETGLNFIQYNGGQGKPEPLQLCETPKEIFTFIGMLERVGETITSINAVQRGDVAAIGSMQARSGNSLALIQAQTLSFLSGFQKSYTNLLEDVWTGILHILQDYAAVPRVAAIVGKNSKLKLQEFTKEDISLIDRVFCDVGNPLSQQLGGRVQMAENLIQMFAKDGRFTPGQYMEVMNTGRLDLMTDPVLKQQDALNSENENLISGDTPVFALILDEHLEHIKSHRGIIDDPYLRNDDRLLQRVLAHIQEHINILKTGDPLLLATLGEQPISSQNPPPAPGAGLIPPGPSAPITGGPMQVPPPPMPAKPMPPQINNSRPIGSMNPSHKKGPTPIPGQKLQNAQHQMPKIALPAQSPDGRPVLPSQMPVNP